MKPICRCGVYKYVHDEGRGCGNYREASRLRVWLMDHSIRAHVIAPIWLRIPEKQRWRIVDRLNRSQRRCWSHLVDAAIAYPETDACDIRTPNIRGEKVPRCASECGWMHDHAEGCGCYCGKFRFTTTEDAR